MCGGTLGVRDGRKKVLSAFG